MRPPIILHKVVLPLPLEPFSCRVSPFFREKDNDMERLYQDGHITREELEQMKAANERLRKSQVRDGFLEDMSADFDENYDETPLEDENYTEDEDIYTEGDESSSFVSNNDEIDKLYRDGKISAAEWRWVELFWFCRLFLFFYSSMYFPIKLVSHPSFNLI